MKEFRILIFEDDTPWKEAFEFNIRPQIEARGVKFLIRHKQDDSTLQEDLEWLPNLILVDYDLGELTGEQIIESIDNDPDFNKVSIYFYSGGETLEDLQSIARKFQCKIHCHTKEGNSLEISILGLL